MYLYATRHFSKYEDAEKASALRKEFKVQNSDNLETVELHFEVGYWRKANAIHQWFVDKCQDGADDCRPGHVNREDLQDLKVVCENELKCKDNPEESDEQIEPKAGFFFGTYEKDEWYYDSLEHTIKIVDECLEMSEDFSFQYESSW